MRQGAARLWDAITNQYAWKLEWKQERGLHLERKHNFSIPSQPWDPGAGKEKEGKKKNLFRSDSVPRVIAHRKLYQYLYFVLVLWFTRGTCVRVGS